jgi:hypothetical protein
LRFSAVDLAEPKVDRANAPTGNRENRVSPTTIRRLLVSTFADRHCFQRDLKHQIEPGHAIGDAWLLSSKNNLHLFI